MGGVRVDPELELNLEIVELDREFGLDLEVREKMFELDCY